jgi:acetyl-CoA acetyltransferase
MPDQSRITRHPIAHLAMLMLCALLVAGLSDPASAAGQVRFEDGLEVNYSAMPSSRLAEDVASRYGIPRSRIQGLLLVSARRGPDNARLDVRGEAVDRRDRRQALQFREINSGGQVSYIALARVEAGELLRFELTVRERDASTRHPLRFSERFHAE